jgi:hypothetical protein
MKWQELPRKAKQSLKVAKKRLYLSLKYNAPKLQKLANLLLFALILFVLTNCKKDNEMKTMILVKPLSVTMAGGEGNATAQASIPITNTVQRLSLKSVSVQLRSIGFVGATTDTCPQYTWAANIVNNSGFGESITAGTVNDNRILGVSENQQHFNPSLTMAKSDLSANIYVALSSVAVDNVDFNFCFVLEFEIVE